MFVQFAICFNSLFCISHNFIYFPTFDRDKDNILRSNNSNGISFLLTGLTGKVCLVNSN